MFMVTQIEDVCVAKHVEDLKLPLTVHDLENFEETLELLFYWKKHHQKLQNIVVPAYHRLRDEQQLSLMRSTGSTTVGPTYCKPVCCNELSGIAENT